MAPLEQHAQLRRAIAECFDDRELRALCADLGVDYDELGSEGLSDSARALVAYLGRRGRVSELVRVCARLRPHLSWYSPGGTPVQPLNIDELFKGMERMEKKLDGIAAMLGADDEQGERARSIIERFTSELQAFTEEVRKLNEKGKPVKAGQ